MSQSAMSSGPVPRPAPPLAAPVPASKPPLEDVLVELWQNMEKLMRQEVALATAELDLKAQRLKAELIASAAGAALILAGSLALVATVVLLLDLIMPAWTAALITGAASAGGGYALLKSNKPSLAEAKPERTIRSLEKDIHTFTEPSK